MKGDVFAADGSSGSTSQRRWTVERMARAATRLAKALMDRDGLPAEVAEACVVLRAQCDLLDLHYLAPGDAHEASQGAYLQAQHLEWQANNTPDPHRRADLMRRARTAFAVGERLRCLGPNPAQSQAKKT